MAATSSVLFLAVARRAHWALLQRRSREGKSHPATQESTGPLCGGCFFLVYSPLDVCIQLRSGIRLDCASDQLLDV